MLKMFIIVYMIGGLIISALAGYLQYVADEYGNEEIKSMRDNINQNYSVIYVMLIWFLLWPAVVASAIVCFTNHKNGGGSK